MPHVPIVPPHVAKQIVDEWVVHGPAYVHEDPKLYAANPAAYFHKAAQRYGLDLSSEPLKKMSVITVIRFEAARRSPRVLWHEMKRQVRAAAVALRDNPPGPGDTAGSPDHQ